MRSSGGISGSAGTSRASVSDPGGEQPGVDQGTLGLIRLIVQVDVVGGRSDSGFRSLFGAQAMTEAQQTEVHHGDRTDGRR
jgi:hypothetical protein